MRNVPIGMRQLICATTWVGFICGCETGEQASEGSDDTEWNPNLDTERIVDTSGEGGCVFAHSLSMSGVIPTVGTVEWSVVPNMAKDARIEFGLDTDYEFSAPGRYKKSSYTTAILGMKPNSTYHYRLVATVADTVCTSGDYTLRTGPLPTGIPMPTITTKSDAVEPGFTISAFFTGGKRAFILDSDGEYVWWYTPKGNKVDWVRARMSYDGRYMFIANGNVPSMGNGALVRVKMDGTGEKTYDVPNRHHDVLILPDETVVTMEYDTSGKGTCDRVMEMDPETGEAVEVFRLRDHFSQLASDGEWCHSNAINYVPSEDAYYMSVLNQNMIVKWNRSSKEPVWTFGGEASDIPDASWRAQHQFQILPDGILFFNNRISVFSAPSDRGTEETIGPSGGGFFGGDPSHVLEWRVDESSDFAEVVWDYSSASLNSYSMGDAKRLSGGNTLVAYSTQGILQEVDAKKNLVREIKWPAVTIGYANRVSSLYDVPPEYDFYPHR